MLFIVTRMNVGGPARQILVLERGLSAHLDVRLAAGTPPPEEGELLPSGLPVHRVPLVRPVRPAVDVRALVAVRRLLRATRPDIVHTHMAKAGAVGRAGALTLGDRPRVVHTFHGHVLDGYFGGAAQRAFVQVERVLARRTDVLVAVSAEIRDELLDLGIGRAGQYEVIPLGLDLERFLAVPPLGRAPRAGPLRSVLGLGPEVPLAGVLGRLVPVKDHVTLFRALAELPEVHLAVVGDGELRPDIEEAARELGVAARVHFTGWWTDVPSALADLDVVVLSSRREGTPLALVEALAAARPVVATDVGGVRSVVEDGAMGWLCPPSDPGALAASIAYVLAHPQEAGARAAEGRRRVGDRFGEVRAVADHLALYEALLARRRPRRRRPRVSHTVGALVANVMRL